jgi:acetyl-CoA synthetase
LKGHIIKSYCILRQGYEGSENLEKELRDHVGNEMGPIAKPTTVEFVENLPKTRSGKIMRRVLKAQVLGEDLGDLSTLAD